MSRCEQRLDRIAAYKEDRMRCTLANIHDGPHIYDPALKEDLPPLKKWKVVDQTPKTC